MSLTFSLTTGEALPLVEGLPPNFTGPRLRGAYSTFVSKPFGTITLQEYRYRHTSISLTNINWKKSERVICNADYPPVLFVRSLLKNNIIEVIKGAGEYRVDQRHFYAIAGNKWSSFLEPGEPGDHYLLDLTWEAESLKEVFDNLPSISLTSGLPDKLMDIPCCNSLTLQRIFDDLVNVDYSFSSQRVIFHELMSKCLSYVVKEIIAKWCIRNKMSDSDWYYVQKAKEVIHENLDRRISTPEISVKIGVNEYKLKKLFRRATGYAIDEYRKHHLFTSAAKSMVQSQETMLKKITSGTGYVSEASLIRAFKTAMFCTPGEMRSGQWDTSRLNTIPPSKWKPRG